MGTTVPAVGTFHSASEGRNGWYETLRSPLQALLKRLAVRTAVSAEAQRIVELTFGIRCEIVPNGIELADFADGDAWPAPTPAILFVGRHEPRKGLEVLLDAFAGLDRDAVLWIVGDGPQTAALRGRGVSRVEWLGPGERRREAGAPAGRHDRVLPVARRRVVRAGAARGDGGRAPRSSRPRSTATATSPVRGVEADAGASGRRRPPPATPSPSCSTSADRRAELVAAGRARAAEFSMVAVAERFVGLYERAIAGAPMPESAAGRAV